MKRSHLWPVLAGMILVLSACARLLPIPQAATLEPSPSLQPSPTSAPTEAPTLATEIPDPVGIFAGLPVEAYEEAILDYLNDGGQPHALVGALSGPEDQPTGHRAWTGDVNGDGRTDLAAGLIQLEPPELQPPGQLLVFLSGPEGDYHRAYDWMPEPPLGSPQVEFFQDLDADGQDEMIVSARTCGAHTCFLTVRLLDWDGAALVDLNPGDTSELPEPQLAVDDPDADGVFDVLIVPTGIGSAGAGAYRGENQRWVLVDGAWTVQSERQPPQYLIHAIHEGDDLLEAGRLPEAREWYTRVVNQDPVLQLSGLVEDEVALLSSFAVFRLAQIALLSGDPATADGLIQSAENSPAATGRGAPYLVLAQLYRQAFDGRNPAGACEVILGFIQGREDIILMPLGSQAFGYANRDYAAEDFCPPAVATP